MPGGASGGLLELLGASPGSKKFLWGLMLRVQEVSFFCWAFPYCILWGLWRAFGTNGCEVRVYEKMRTIKNRNSIFS